MAKLCDIQYWPWLYEVRHLISIIFNIFLFVKTGLPVFEFGTSGFAAWKHLQNVITSSSKLQNGWSIYLFRSSRWVLHHAHLQSAIWLHLLVFSSTSSFLEWNLTKLPKKSFHNLQNMSKWPNYTTYNIGHDFMKLDTWFEQFLT